MNYEIDQVLYVISKEAATIFPIKVVEEVTKKTTAGSETTYVVQRGPDVMNIALIKGDIYSDVEEVRKVMTEKIQAIVDTTIATAQAFAIDNYNATTDVTIKERVEVTVSKTPDETAQEQGKTKVNMPDGSVQYIDGVSF